MTEPRPSFLRVWLGLLLLLIIALVPVVLIGWLLSLLPLPWWLGFLIMMGLGLTFSAWVMTSRWLSQHILSLSRWSGMLR